MDFSADELLTPPKPTGNMYPIQKALENSVTGRFKLKYPTSGKYQSAFVFADLLNTGYKDYCIAFYATGQDSTQNIHINLIKNTEDGWQSMSDAFFAASAVEKVEFADLNGDDNLEIIVGYNIYSSVDKQVVVYSLAADTLRQRMAEMYNNFLITDLNMDGGNELFVINLDTAKHTSTAKMYTLNESGIKEEGACNLDATVASHSEPVLSKLANDQPAVFVDAVKGKGMVTEVVYFKDNTLVAPFVNEKTGQNILTQRDMTVACMDINNDGRLDIPLMEASINSGSSDTGSNYITRWVNYNGAELFAVQYSIMNYVDGYYLNIPESYVGNIAVEQQIESRLRIFYLWDSENMTPKDELFRIMVINLSDWDEKRDELKDYFELSRDKNYVYIGKVGGYFGNEAVSPDDLRSMFNLING